MSLDNCYRCDGFGTLPNGARCPVCGGDGQEPKVDPFEAGDRVRRPRAIPCPYGQDGERVCCGNPRACKGPTRGAVSLMEYESV
jgi:hypothetical protein